MIKLTEEQHQALAAETPPALVLDPTTNETYRLVKTALYTRIENLLQADDTAISKRDVAALVARTMHEYDQHDTTLELYQLD